MITDEDRAAIEADVLAAVWDMSLVSWCEMREGSR